jgi:hypothetical protein
MDTININKLGIRVDGWADLVEDAGEKADEAFKVASQTMEARDMPNVMVNSTQISIGTLISKKRPYIMAKLPNGATITVYIGAFGQDLYASWDLYVRPLLNWTTLLIIFVISSVVATPCGLMGIINGLSNLDNRFTQGFGWTQIVGAVGGTGCFTLVLIIFLVILVGIAGQLTKGHALAFFIKELTVFDADDIGAMSLAVHKSVLHALDSVGISVQILRLKEQFRAGSRERLI